VQRPAGIEKTVCKGANRGKIDIRLNIAKQLDAGETVPDSPARSRSAALTAAGHSRPDLRQIVATVS